MTAHQNKSVATATSYPRDQCYGTYVVNTQEVNFITLLSRPCTAHKETRFHQLAILIFVVMSQTLKIFAMSTEIYPQHRKNDYLLPNRRLSKTSTIAT